MNRPRPPPPLCRYTTNCLQNNLRTNDNIIISFHGKHETILAINGKIPNMVGICVWSMFSILCQKPYIQHLRMPRCRDEKCDEDNVGINFN